MSVPLSPAVEPALRNGSIDRAPTSALTTLLDWDRARCDDGVPRAVEVPPDAASPTWLVVPHARYVLCARHLKGRVETVYAASLVGKRDSLIPAGAVDSISMDEHSVTVVVEGRPYLYVVDGGTTLDVIARRVLGAA